MTPRQRMNAAMNLKPTDKVPLMCQFSIGHMLQQLKVSPSEFWFDQELFTNGLIKLRDIYNFDGILVSLHGHNLKWKENIKQTHVTEEHETVEWINGDTTIFPFNDLPYYLNKQVNPIIDLNSFDESVLPPTLNYIPVSNNLHFNIDPENKFGAIESIVNQYGDKYSIHGEITSPFDYFLDLTGYQDGLFGLLINPGDSKKILSHFTEKIKSLAIEMCETGIDAIKLSSPFAGAGFISPDTYGEFVLPYEKEIAVAVRRLGVHIYTHTCGSINDRLELMFESGISGIECLDPPPLGDIELFDAFKRIAGKGFIKGNIDSVNLLLKGSPGKIKSEVNKMLKTAKGNPGFILSTACSIAPNVSRENILLLRELIVKTGHS
jgi:uroporphyrinogen-III decarboxylase